MKAIKVVEKGKAEVQEVPVPQLRDDYVLCKVNWVAVNATDWFVPSLSANNLQNLVSM